MIVLFFRLMIVKLKILLSVVLGVGEDAECLPHFVRVPRVVHKSRLIVKQLQSLIAQEHTTAI